MIVNRGLPTENLNNAAGDLRSNVEWADNEASLAPTTFYLPGDDFTLPGSGAYYVKKIRVWSTDKIGLSLLGGLQGGPIAPQSSTFTATLVTTYDGGLGYQGNSGGYSPVYQIDFSVNIPLNGGQTYQFFLDGPLSVNPPANGGGYANAYLHASNAALSGSTQQGSDDTFLWLDPDGNVLTWFSGTGGGTSGWGSANNVDTDANVQVFASQVATSKDQCMKGGWMNLVRANGTPFKNQGDAIQYVNTGK